MQQVKGVLSQLKLRLQRARARYGWVDVTVRTTQSFSGSDGGSYTAALTYYTFFSLFPLLLFSTAVLGWITGSNAELRAELMAAGEGAVPLLSDVLNDETLTAIQERATNIAFTGVALALYSGTGAVVALEHALNRFDGVTEEPGWLQKRIRSLRFLGVFWAGILISIALGAVAGVAPRLLGPAGAIAGWLLGHAVGLVVGLLLFMGAYKLLPVRSRSWKDVWPGALAAAILFEVLKEAGAWYMQRGAQGREATFGAFALAAGLLVACYLISQITLMSAHLNKALEERRKTRESLVGLPKEA